MDTSETYRRFRARLDQAAQVWRRERAICLVLRSLVWLLAAWPVYFVLDAFFHLPDSWRLVLDLLWLGTAAGLAGFALWSIYGRVTPPERIARRLESNHPELGSRLINLIQLHGDAAREGRSELTRRLADRAVARGLEEIGPADLAALVRSQAPAKAARRALWQCALVLVVLACAWPVTRAGVWRYLLPYGDHPAFAFTRLKIAEPDVDGYSVVYGEPLMVRVVHSGHRPHTVRLSYHPEGRPEETTMLDMFDQGGDRGYVQRIDRVTDNLVLTAENDSGRAVSPRRLVSVLLTPELRETRLTVTPPAYTGHQPRTQAYSLSDLRVLDGSSLRFELTSNRPLSGGRLQLVEAGQVVETVKLDPIAENTVAAEWTPTRGGIMVFSLTDIMEIESAAEWKAGLTLLEDLPPSAGTDPSKEMFCVINHPLAVRCFADDDYGISRLRIHRGINGLFAAPLSREYAGAQTHVSEALAFDFTALGAQPGDTVSVFVEAIDTAPVPQTARSGTLQLHIISEQDYNDYLRRERDMKDMEAKYLALRDEVYQLANDQRTLAEQIAQLEEALAAAPDEATREEIAAQLEELKKRQQALNASVNALADKMEHFVRETPLYDVEDSFRENLQRRADELRASARENALAMAAARNQPLPAQMRTMREAARMQAETLDPSASDKPDALAEMGETMGDLADLHEIIKDMELFQLLYQEQETITEQMQAYQNRYNLTREDQLALREMAERQRAVAAHLQGLDQKLRQDAESARENFPKAAACADGLADAIRRERLPALAESAATAMLEGQGGLSAGRSEQLRRTMESLIGEEQSAQSFGQMAGELDGYLGPSRRAGETLRQMMQSRRFRLGSSLAAEFGMGGQSGFAMASQPMNVYGGEASQFAGPQGQGRDAQAASDLLSGEDGIEAALDQVDVLDRVRASTRESEAIRVDYLHEEYREIVNEYFETITRGQPNE
ncbi:hypothetical protein H5P28_06675 [Ruficoccus amylovorans]|uniref:DUF4175 family protein n=1 Tax=Ruficoccus amylovorans TaxID=1804625 RepID=A0A842HBU9_9BACT|nr:hypothetical protein [Ruficoccus amylovorans]MBC2593943.1 hypothetical protein [Ruficoccus amylovorans]